jgi:hypothetical protein
LAVEESGGGYFIAADMFGDCFEGEVFACLCVEESDGGFGEIGMLGCL